MSSSEFYIHSEDHHNVVVREQEISKYAIFGFDNLEIFDVGASSQTTATLVMALSIGPFSFHHHPLVFVILIQQIGLLLSSCLR